MFTQFKTTYSNQNLKEVISNKVTRNNGNLKTEVSGSKVCLGENGE